MISTAKLTSKGQITLPKRVRGFLGVDSGDTVIFQQIDDVLVVRKAPSIERLFGKLPPLPKDWRERVAAEIAADGAGKK